MRCYVSLLISFFTGVFGNFFTKLVEIVWKRGSNKNKKLEESDDQFHIIDKKLSHKISNNIIFLDVDGKNFSTIANLYMGHPKNNKFIITNIKEPSWFYKRFKDYVDSAGRGDTKAKDLLSELESNIDDLNKAAEIVEKLASLFYAEHNDIKIFPHLRSFVTASATKRVRINFFNLILNNENSREEFKDRNKKHVVFFFEKFINYNSVVSLYQNIDAYQGTDALILNEERVLNHDDLINELHYQKNNFVKEINNGFFYNVIKDFKGYERGEKDKYRLTSDIWKQEEMYGIHI